MEVHQSRLIWWDFLPKRNEVAHLLLGHISFDSVCLLNVTHPNTSEYTCHVAAKDNWQQKLKAEDEVQNISQKSLIAKYDEPIATAIICLKIIRYTVQTISLLKKKTVF